MHKVAVVGAGKIGSTIASLLTGAYEVLVIDQNAQALADLDAHPAPAIKAVPIDDPATLAAALQGCFAVINAAPYHLTTIVAQAAKIAGAHYLDLTEDVAASRVVRELAADAKTAFIPQCGLAASSPSPPGTWPSTSMNCTTCACGSAPCRAIRPTP
jgi:saccharopine dehydrogenase-like NADP-dependent oxidoreductase